MDIQTLILIIVIGGIAGWLAGFLTKGGGFGIVGNVAIGVVGAFVGGFVLQLLGLYAGGLIGSIVSATLGSVILLVVIGLIKKS